jgi:hypothetical protein
MKHPLSVVCKIDRVYRGSCMADRMKIVMGIQFIHKVPVLFYHSVNTIVLERRK